MFSFSYLSVCFCSFFMSFIGFVEDVIVFYFFACFYWGVKQDLDCFCVCFITFVGLLCLVLLCESFRHFFHITKQ